MKMKTEEVRFKNSSNLEEEDDEQISAQGNQCEWKSTAHSLALPVGLRLKPASPRALRLNAEFRAVSRGVDWVIRWLGYESKTARIREMGPGP
jgi:hypothetical protein